MLFEFFDRDGLADDRICMELHAQRTQTLYLYIDYMVRQTELGNTVFEHTAYLMQRLKNVYLIPVFGGIAGKGQTRRATTHNGDFHHSIIERLCRAHSIIMRLRIRIVCAETLEVSDCYCRMTHLQMDALTLALFLLRTHTTAHCRQRRTLFDDCCSSEYIARLQFLDEARDIDIHRTTLYTGRVLAVQAAMTLRDCLLERQTLVHFLMQTLYTHFRS